MHERSAQHGGATIGNHVYFISNNLSEYRYTKNVNGKWEAVYDVTMDVGLSDRAWDVIMIQPGKTDYDDTFNLSGRRTLEEYVRRYVDEDTVFMWHTSWPNPDDETFWAPDYERQPPKGYRENLEQLYGFNIQTQYDAYMKGAKSFILNDDTYVNKCCTATPIMYALNVLGCTQLDLYRDYTHLNDFGRLIVSYALYAQLVGEALDEVRIDTVKASMRQARYQGDGDLIVTSEMKDIIIEAASYSLEHRWELPS